ncbi:hypothetical protein L1887_45944 [Cichorium endivia]|nr:hypothetical protein L1887_45944 [Cichorium endivia]
METESQASFSIGKETGELAVMETIRMDDMDFFEMVNHFFNREREVIQNPLAPEWGRLQRRCRRRQHRLKLPTPLPIKKKERERTAVRALSGNDGNLVECREGDNVLRSGDLRGDGYRNPPQMEPLFPAGIEVSRAGEGDAFLERANQKFHFEFRPQHPAAWCFTISIGNERRSGGTCGTTYWITPVRHEAADAESAPMPLAMPCLVPRHGGASVARHEHRAKGRLSNSSEPPYLTTT